MGPPKKTPPSNATAVDKTMTSSVGTASTVGFAFTEDQMIAQMEEMQAELDAKEAAATGTTAKSTAVTPPNAATAATPDAAGSDGAERRRKRKAAAEKVAG